MRRIGRTARYNGKLVYIPLEGQRRIPTISLEVTGARYDHKILPTPSARSVIPPLQRQLSSRANRMQFRRHCRRNLDPPHKFSLHPKLIRTQSAPASSDGGIRRARWLPRRRGRSLCSHQRQSIELLAHRSVAAGFGSLGRSTEPPGDRNVDSRGHIAVSNRSPHDFPTCHLPPTLDMSFYGIEITANQTRRWPANRQHDRPRALSSQQSSLSECRVLPLPS
jgi:hypothetical protein